MIKIDESKPSIVIYYNEQLKDTEKFNEILWGIEEEGIPYEIKSIKSNDIGNLSYSACQKSKLGVGIGIDNFGNVYLTYNKLFENQYIYKENLENDEISLRNLGSNSARLVKNIIFKEV